MDSDVKRDVRRHGPPLGDDTVRRWYYRRDPTLEVRFKRLVWQNRQARYSLTRRSALSASFPAN